MAQANLYLGVLQKSKLTDGFYTCGLDRYIVFTKNRNEPTERSSGGVLPMYLRFVVELIQKFGPNFVIFHL